MTKVCSYLTAIPASAYLDTVLLDCSWKILANRSPVSLSGNHDCWQTIDVVFESNFNAHARRHDLCHATNGFDGTWVRTTDLEGEVVSMASKAFGSASAFRGLLQFLIAASSRTSGCVAKFVIPLTSGQIIRSDIVPLRLIDCEVVTSAMSFAEPLQFYPGIALARDQLYRLDQIMASSVAGLLLQEIPSGCDDLETMSKIAEAELNERLSFPWISRKPLGRLRLALVEGCAIHPNDGGTAANIYPVAKALGIDLVVLDNPGHWLERGDYDHWREAFIPTKLVHTADPEFTNRIVASIRSHDKSVDGIITFFDKYTVDVANAAVTLGLPTGGSPEAYRIATNKYETSIVSGHNGFRASNAEEAVRLASLKMVEYPLIVKPCNGWSSEGVFRVSNPDELEEAARSIDQDRHGRDFVVEKYCSGPEVDANFVLLDGQILFFESSDDAPKSADSNASRTSSSGSQSSNFIELCSVFPSALPKRELDMLRDDFHDILTDLGFTNGIMHLEGRMENSSLEYRVDNNGITDLHEKVIGSLAPTSPTPWLIEINPRPPGMKGTQIIESTYGVDYWGLDMLLALGQDKGRIRALSRPFKNGPQYASVMVFIPADYPVECQGIFDSDDICDELFVRRPALIGNVSRSGCLAKRGQKIPHPNSGIHSFLAYFNVFSRLGRKEALRLATLVREEVRFSFK